MAAVTVVDAGMGHNCTDGAVDWAQMLCEETDGDACITTGVGQHQMWAAQWYTYDLPRRWASSGASFVIKGRTN